MARGRRRSAVDVQSVRVMSMPATSPAAAQAFTALSPFAQDESDLAGIANALAPFIEAGSDLQWMVLLDNVFDHGKQAPNFGMPFNCYRSFENADELASIAPTLFRLSPDEGWRVECERFLQHTTGRPMLSILASHLDAPRLCDHWTPLHRVWTTDGLRRPLRLADTHTLASLPDLLTPSQWKAYAGPLAHWFYVDRKGQLARCAPAEDDAKADAEIRLDDVQFGRLVDEAGADTLYAHLAEGVPEDFPRDMKPSRIYAELQRVLDLAIRRGVDGFPDQVALGHSTLITRGRTSRDDVLDATLQAGEWMPGALDETLMRLGLME